ncbi:RING-type domain-containing protein [Mycena sanguinolenta]|uniref:RING-type domain-containing protein n=1 Tax=Mycena sanguinolenta TaxID=230812 RepID=A0A8H7CKK8_9AGAR|nr:RING-type domain-containing protein [Mycena sanguinolenta]
MECATWRRHVEAHAAANTNLLGFARAAKDCALRLRAERDAERSRYVLLKRKFTELMPELDQSPFATKRKHAEDEDPKGKAAAVVVPRRGLPIFVMQCKSASAARANSSVCGRRQGAGPG